MGIDLIFSDIDGTLLNSELKVTKETRLEIQRADAQGVPFVLVSARMPDAIYPIRKQIGIEAPVISYNGALVEDEKGQVLFSHPMPKDLALKVCQLVELDYPDICWNVYGHRAWLSQASGSAWIDREEAIVGLVSQKASIEEVDAQLGEIHKVLLMGDPERMPALEERLKKAFPDLSITQSAPYFIELTAAGIGKGQAVSFLSDRLGVPLSQTIAFGDNYNDLDMLQTVGQGFAMGNAPQAVKDKVGRVAADNNHDGIAQVLSDLF